MNKILVIVESPAKCDKIEKYLGKDYKVIGSFGHITQLSSLDDIDINNNFKPTFKTIESKSKQIDKIKRAIDNSTEVILATDDDREGEAIAWHICNVFNLDVTSTKRIIFHEITKTAIDNAIKNPGFINCNLVYAQQARQTLDILVGFKITPFLWSHIVSNTKKSLSAGRCQTPALRLVYDNYLDIKNSPGRIEFNTSALFTDKQISFNLNHNHDNNSDIEKFLELSKHFDHEFNRDNITNVEKKSPLPFTTSALQQSSNTNLNISPKETMSLAQTLYEAGYITYMRTDSRVYSKEFVESCKRYIINTYNNGYIHPSADNLVQNRDNSDKDVKPKLDDKKTKKSKKAKNDNNAQEAHEAIRPTDITCLNIPDDEDVFSTKHRKLYKLIWTNSITSLMANAVYEQLKVSVTAPNKLLYKYTSENNIFPGWKIINGVESDKYYNYLLNLSCGDINYNKIISKQSIKDLKHHYNEAKLVQLLEEKGIGRPSTFSSLIEKIQERGYVKLDNIRGKKLKCREYSLENSIIIKNDIEREFGNEKNRLVITPTGILVIEFLINNFNELFDYGYTKNMENYLDKIAKGECLYNDICQQCYETITNMSKTNLKTDHEKPKDKFSVKIDDKHTYIIGKNGPTIKYTEFDSAGNKIDKFYSVKDNLDMDKLRVGEYTIDDIKDENNKIIGIYKNYSIYLKKGQYGPYLEWNNVKKALKYIKINVPYSEITIDDAINIFEKSESGENSLIRKIDDNISIRSGKYGDYIFYKTNKMNKPKFLKLNGFDYNYKDCNQEILLNWIRDKYNIVVN